MTSYEKALHVVLHTGGYITTDILAQWRPEIQYQSHAKTMRQLVDRGYLIARPEHRYGKEAIIYQVTRRACASIGRPNSYMRNKHTLEHIHRALIRAYYLCGLLGQGFSFADMVCFSEERAAYFLKFGVSERVLPAKYNAGIRKTQIDEHLLLLSPSTRKPDLIIMHTHRSKANEWRQLHNLMERYALLLQHPLSPPFSFLVVCERPDQVLAYQRAAAVKSDQFGIAIDIAMIDRSFLIES